MCVYRTHAQHAECDYHMIITNIYLLIYVIKKCVSAAHQEALKKEIERLRKVYHEQNIKQMGNNSSTTTSAPSQPPASFNNMNYTDGE